MSINKRIIQPFRKEVKGCKGDVFEGKGQALALSTHAVSSVGVDYGKTRTLGGARIYAHFENYTEKITAI